MAPSVTLAYVGLGYFYPGWQVEPWGPLAWEVPPWPRDAARLYLEAFTEPGDLVVDAFAGEPGFLLEARRLGRRAAGSEPNPVLAYLGRMRLSPPPPGTFHELLQELGRVEKVGRPLREVILASYAPSCPQCGAGFPLAETRAAIWEGEEPVESEVHCRKCGRAGRYPWSGEGVEGQERPGLGHRALRQRLQGTLSLELEERLLELVPRRARELLGETLLKAESHLSEHPAFGAWPLLCLYALAAGHRLQPEPPRPEPWGSFSPPKRWREPNLWLGLEAGVEELELWIGEAEPQSALSLASALRGEGVWLQEGSVRLLLRSLPSGSVRLAVGRLPNLNSPFQALCCLWACCLWGPEEGARLAGLLQGKGFDARSYRRALAATLAELQPVLGPAGRVALFLEGSLHSLAPAALLALEEAAFELEEVLYLEDGALGAAGGRPAYRLHARPREPAGRPADGQAQELEASLLEAGTRAGAELLRRRAEPAREELIRASVLGQWARGGLIRRAAPAREAERMLEGALSRVLDSLLEGHARRSEDGLEPLSPAAEEPLSQRVGRQARLLLEAEPELGLDGLARRLGVLFPGLESPSRRLLEVCLATYGQARAVASPPPRV